MCRLSSYRLHKSSGRAVVTLGGKDHYLGVHGSPESRALYQRLVAEHLARSGAPAKGEGSYTVNELCAAYEAFARTWYVKAGRATSQVERIAQALARLRTRLQLLTGTRPGEVAALRPADVDRSGGVWVYRVRDEDNQTAHHGGKRVVFIGPKRQAILAPHLLRDAEVFRFGPREEVERLRARKELGGRFGRRRQPGERYTTMT